MKQAANAPVRRGKAWRKGVTSVKAIAIYGCDKADGVFIQALRAFRRAELVVDAVLFESCVGGVAVAMTCASIFNLEFWLLWGVVLGAFVNLFWMPLWVLRASLGVLEGVIWGSFG